MNIHASVIARKMRWAKPASLSPASQSIAKKHATAAKDKATAVRHTDRHLSSRLDEVRGAQGGL